MDETSKNERPVWRVALLAAALLVLGFISGYGFQTRQHAEQTASGPGSGEAPPAVAPLVRGLRARPDDRLLAFTGVYDQSQRAARFVFDLVTKQISVAETPAGWQDYITQWSADGSKILFEREKIPRPAVDAVAGLHEEEIRAALPASTRSASAPQSGAPSHEEPIPLSGEDIPAGERIISGQWGPDGLVVKTRREPKALYLMRPDGPQLLDRASVTYYQNREVRENGRPTLYVVRDVPGQRREFALFRVQNGQAKQLGPAFRNIVWAYISENVRWLIVCRQAENGEDWSWSLYAVSPQTARLVKTADVPGDVIAVYWSPDYRHVLGSSGQSLWLIEMPTLKARRLGPRTDWNADDAAWLNREQAIVVASAGVLWKVRVPDGKATQLWKFPPEYWK